MIIHVSTKKSDYWAGDTLGQPAYKILTNKIYPHVEPATKIDCVMLSCHLKNNTVIFICYGFWIYLPSVVRNYQ